jgi:hypothetical protein
VDANIISGTGWGVQFADRPDTDPGKRPVRESVGVDPELNQRWSTRRVLIKDRPRQSLARWADHLDSIRPNRQTARATSQETKNSPTMAYPA